MFLCFKEPQFWPSVVEGAESDRLPRFLAAAIKSRENEMMRKTWLIICEGRDGTESSNGDVMIFPDMIRYRGLTHFDVDAFVDEVLVHNREWLPGRPERLLGTHVFVCAHGSREVEFGVLGPVIIKRFKEQIASRGLGALVYVKPCSYIEGYKYERNLIVYSSNTAGEVSGHCYGYVTPENVSNVLDDFFGKGYLAAGCDRCSGILDPEPEQARQNLLPYHNCALPSTRNETYHAREWLLGQANGQIKLSIDGLSKVQGLKAFRKGGDNSEQKKRIYSSSRLWQASWWFDFWENEDTIAALAVVGAAASVALAYHLYRTHSQH